MKGGTRKVGLKLFYYKKHNDHEKICTLEYFLSYGSCLSIVTAKIGCAAKVLKYINVVWYIKSIYLKHPMYITLNRFLSKCP